MFGGMGSALEAFRNDPRFAAFHKPKVPPVGAMNPNAVPMGPAANAVTAPGQPLQAAKLKPDPRYPGISDHFVNAATGLPATFAELHGRAAPTSQPLGAINSAAQPMGMNPAIGSVMGAAAGLGGGMMGGIDPNVLAQFMSRRQQPQPPVLGMPGYNNVPTRPRNPQREAFMQRLRRGGGMFGGF